MLILQDDPSKDVNNVLEIQIHSLNLFGNTFHTAQILKLSILGILFKHLSLCSTCHVTTVPTARVIWCLFKVVVQPKKTCHHSPSCHFNE